MQIPTTPSTSTPLSSTPIKTPLSSQSTGIKAQSTNSKMSTPLTPQSFVIYFINTF